MKKQLTKQEAIGLYNTGITKEWTADQIVRFQLWQNKIFMAKEVYIVAIEQILGRKVTNDEIGWANEQLKREYLKKGGTVPTDEEFKTLVEAGLAKLKQQKLSTPFGKA